MSPNEKIIDNLWKFWNMKNLCSILKLCIFSLRLIVDNVIWSIKKLFCIITYIYVSFVRQFSTATHLHTNRSGVSLLVLYHLSKENFSMFPIANNRITKFLFWFVFWPKNSQIFIKIKTFRLFHKSLLLFYSDFFLLD